MRIGIVGADGTKWKPEQVDDVKKLIRHILISYTSKRQYDWVTNQTILVFDEVVLVSGHCPLGGVDIWAEAVADELGIKKEIYPPEVNQWNDLLHQGIVKKGYKSRNIDIAVACNVLHCIEPYYRQRSGGMWTLRYAESLGKEVHQHVLSQNKQSNRKPKLSKYD